VLELARTEDVDLVRFVRSNLDYLRLLNERALRKLTGSGVPGSTVLNEALGRPLPLLARTRSWFEVRLIRVCELTGMRLPDDTNVEIAGYLVDAVWWTRWWSSSAMARPTTGRSASAAGTRVRI
jgi:hypothetical protein